MSPSIAVNSGGTVAIAYATDRTCVDPATSGCNTWGDSVVVSTTTTNGTSWSVPSVAGTGVGETTCALGACVNGLFQGTPQTSAAYTAAGDLLVAYSGTYSQPGMTGASNYRFSGVSAALTTNGESSWSTQVLGDVARGSRRTTPMSRWPRTGPTCTLPSRARTAPRVPRRSPSPTCNGSPRPPWPLPSPSRRSFPLASTRCRSGRTRTRRSTPTLATRARIGFNLTGGPLSVFSLPRPATSYTASSSIATSTRTTPTRRT